MTKRLRQLLQHFLSLHPKSIDLSLGRLESLLEKLGNPHTQLPPTIHIAGTNGKGSVLATLRALLQAQDHKVHAYTSPHLVKFNERIRLANALVDDATLIETFEHCERFNNNAPITFFEITTAAAFQLFKQHQADYVLLETGMGGRFDTTNVVQQPILTIITPISMDHMEYLGDSLAKIASEKAGILKPNVPLIMARQPDEVREVILARAEALNVKIIEAGIDFDAYEEAGRLVFQTNHALFDLPLPRLAGDFQIDNTAMALAACLHLNPDIPPHLLETGLQNTIWPARLERLRGSLTKDMAPHISLWLDGGHNLAGAKEVVNFFARLCKQHKAHITLILGMLKNKDIMGYLRTIAAHLPETSIVALTIPDEPNAETAHNISIVAKNVGLKAQTAANLHDAVKRARQEAIQDDAPHHILIGGSLYLAGHVLAENKTPPS